MRLDGGAASAFMMRRVLCPLAAAACAVRAVPPPIIDEFAPVPPFPPSDLTSRVRVAAVSAGPLHEGDTWPSTWAADGEQFLAGCDNKVPVKGIKTKVGVDFFALQGTPEMPRSLNMSLESAYPVPKDFCKRPAAGSFAGTDGIKASGMVGLSDPDALYLGVQCQNYGDNPSFNRQHNVDAWLLQSTDKG
jgi:hypothetical protein